MSSAPQKKAPGERIEARCSRCNDITGHIIVALVDGVIVKVECCACGSVHKYREAKPAQAVCGVRRVRTGESRSASRTPRSGQTSQAVEQQWRAALERPSAPAARTYAVTMTLQKEDVVEHAAFGLGVVQDIIRPDKAVILFRDAVRTMRCVC